MSVASVAKGLWANKTLRDTSLAALAAVVGAAAIYFKAPAAVVAYVAVRAAVAAFIARQS